MIGGLLPQLTLCGPQWAIPGADQWHKREEGYLVGEIAIPMKVGTVGGSLETNPSVRINHRLLGSPNASELAGIMGVVGLAQNFAALRALSTDGIQLNHMHLHSRSVASTAGVAEDVFETVVESSFRPRIKVWKARKSPKTCLAKSPCQRLPSANLPMARSFCSASMLLLRTPCHSTTHTHRGGSRGAHEGDGINVLIPRWGIEQRQCAQHQALPA